MKAGFVSIMLAMAGLGFTAPAQEEASSPASTGVCHEGLLMPVAAKSQEVQSSVIEGIGHLLTFWDEAAYRDFRKAVDADPDCLMANWGLALSLVAPFDERSEEREKAFASLQRLLDTTPVTDREALYAKALHGLLKEGPQSAAEVFREISGKWKNDDVAVLLRAMMVREGFDESGAPRAGQLTARAILDELLARKPDLFAARFGRALIEETAAEVDEATLGHARRAVELAPAYPPAHLLLGHFLFRTGMYEDAEKSFERAAGLFSQWADEGGVSMADNDGYFRAMVYKATSEWCRGDREKAMASARRAADIPVDENRPTAKGSLIQQWEAKTLPFRLKLSEYPSPSEKELGEMFPSRRKSDISSVRELAATNIEEFARARKAFKSGDRNALGVSLSSLDTLEGILAQSGNAAREAGAVSYWARSLWMAERMALEAKAMMFPDSAGIWLENAVDSQQYSSLLLPPILPYPAEWTLARNCLAKKDGEGALKACVAGLNRFPNHAGLLETMKLASKLVSPTKPVSPDLLKTSKKS